MLFLISLNSSSIVKFHFVNNLSCLISHEEFLDISQLVSIITAKATETIG